MPRYLTPDQMSAYLRRTFDAMGLEDLMVMPSLAARGGRSAKGLQLHRLSDIVANNRDVRQCLYDRALEARPMTATEKQFESPYDPFVVYLVLLDGSDSEIGSIDSDARFWFRAAPDLRTAMSYWIATDRGWHGDIRVGAIAPAVVQFEEFVRMHEPSDEVEKEWQKLFRSIWQTNQFSQFHGCTAHSARSFWIMATRLIHGVAHQPKSIILA